MKREKKSKNSEKRSMERFDLGLSATMSVEGENENATTLKLRTTNISAGGAFFKTKQRFPEGTPVKMELVLPVTNVQTLKGNRTRIEITGKVVRKEKDGMAILFDTKYRMQLMENEPPAQIKAPVHVVGHNRLQNELLVRFLKTEANLNCMCDPDACFGAFPDTDPESLVLFDCMGLKKEDAWSHLPKGNPNSCNAAFFNVEPDPEFEKESINRKIRGVFYNDDPPETVREGVVSILSGDLWYSRKILSECVSNPPQNGNLPGIELLTNRETEILPMIASGKRNDEIAKALGVSIHTVKTHVYRIYKKIEVKNRLQASFWAAKHL